MTSHCWNLSKFLSLTCVFLGALGREVMSLQQPSSIGTLAAYTPLYLSNCFGNIEMWSDAYDFPLLESVKISEFNQRFPRGTWSRSSVPIVAEFDRDIGSLHQYTQVIVLKILRCGAMRMTSHCWNLSKFLSWTRVFLGALGREVHSLQQPILIGTLAAYNSIPK